MGIKTKKELVSKRSYFTVMVAGMIVKGIENNGYSVTNENPRDEAKVNFLKLSKDDGSYKPTEFQTKKGVQKVLDILEPDVDVVITEHLMETYREHTTVNVSVSGLDERFGAVRGIVKDGEH